MNNNIYWTENKASGPNTGAETFPNAGKEQSRPPSRTAYTAPPSVPVSRSTQPDPPAQRPMAEMGMQPADTARRDPTVGFIQTVEGPPLVTERGYIPHFLAENIGQLVRAEFFIGNGQYLDKVGRIFEVGINYFVLDDINFNQLVMCDLYSVKFVTILRQGGQIF